MRLSIASALMAAALGLAGPAAAQTTTRGSTLQNAPNTTFGCEVAPRQDFFAGFTMAPHGFPSCSWWSTGSAAVLNDPRSGRVPATGVVTKVRVRAGTNPAPIRIVINRINSGVCCEGVRASEAFTPRPNDITEVTVNLPVENVRDGYLKDGVPQPIGWFDTVGISAAAGTGTLPIHDQGAAAHTPEAAIGSADVITSAMTAPELLPTDGIRVTELGAPGYDLLLQYDHVACPAQPNGQPFPARAAQAGCAQPQTPTSVPVPTATPTATPAPGAPTAALLGPSALRARSGALSLPVRCAAQAPCRGTLRLRTRGARPRTLANAAVDLAAGRTATLRPRLTSAGRSALRRGRRVLARAELTLAGGATVARNVTLRAR